jgi:hypothetical protein
MSVDFGCIETCIFPDFEDYVEPFEDEGMSEEEEDYLDYLLGDENKNKFLPLHREKWLYMYA